MKLVKPVEPKFDDFETGSAYQLAAQAYMNALYIYKLLGGEE